MKFYLIGSLTLMIAVIAGLYWLPERHTASVFAPIPAEHRKPFGIDISLPALRGEPLHLADLRGRVVLLNIWATWCYPCRAEMPAMAALYRRYEDNQAFTIVAVANDPQGQEVVGPFAKEHDLPFPILLDVHNALGTQLELPGIPTSYLLDRQGRIVLREVGRRDWNHPDMHQLVDALLAASTGS
jgi:thiol-disulfide isomerase/thioredoxin